MNQAEEAKLLEQLEQWNKKDEYSRCIRAIEAIPEQERVCRRQLQEEKRKEDFFQEQKEQKTLRNK